MNKFIAFFFFLLITISIMMSSLLDFSSLEFFCRKWSCCLLLYEGLKGADKWWICMLVFSVFSVVVCELTILDCLLFYMQVLCSLGCILSLLTSKCSEHHLVRFLCTCTDTLRPSNSEVWCSVCYNYHHRTVIFQYLHVLSTLDHNVYRAIWLTACDYVQRYRSLRPACRCCLNTECGSKYEFLVRSYDIALCVENMGNLFAILFLELEKALQFTDVCLSVWELVDAPLITVGHLGSEFRWLPSNLVHVQTQVSLTQCMLLALYKSTPQNQNP